MPINLDNIQGNIFGGFNKDFQDFVFVSVKDAVKARKWVADSAKDLISTSEQVLKFNNAFKSLVASGVAKPEAIFSAQWANIAFSASGLKALGFTTANTGDLPDEFAKGMAARSGIIGDIDNSEPAKWSPPFDPATLPRVHGIVLVAADSKAALKSHVHKVTGSAAFLAGFEVLQTVKGRTRTDQVGHEHFGFKDGVSQPGIRELNTPDDPLGNPDQGHPGQDLLWAGEFVLGYPSQIPTEKAGHDGPNPDAGPISTAGNKAWTDDGSFLVFRRLAQNVPEFHQQLAKLAAENNLTVDQMGAKLVGRYKSGCPLEALSMQPFTTDAPPTDPGMANPALADSDALNNAFEFGDDKKGLRCPLGAHIRKAYPRDEDTGHGDDSESNTQTHRLLRRGIPYGESFGAKDGGGPTDERGLLFLAYQSNIKNQFEFVQQTWINDVGFPPEKLQQKGAVHGDDPIIAQSTSGKFELPPSAALITVDHFVTTTGGEYFFAPSIATLKTF